MQTLRIYLGEEKCTTCGRKHQKVFEIDGKPYGSSCAEALLSRQFDAPAWLYKMADEYAVKEFKDAVPTGKLDDFESFGVNFWNWAGMTQSGDQSEHALWNRAVRINGKSVKVDWQKEIHQYLRNLYDQEVERRMHSEQEKKCTCAQGNLESLNCPKHGLEAQKPQGHKYTPGEPVLAYHHGEWRSATYAREDEKYFYVQLINEQEEVAVRELQWF